MDLSARMIEVARRAAAREGLTNVRFEQADAQVHPFVPASVDIALSRTGTMFFGDPVAAFGNISGSLRPGGRLAMLVWQSLSQDEWLLAISTAMAAGRALPAPPPDAPGPFSLSDPERVRGILESSSFVDVAFDPLREPMLFGPTADEAYRFIAGLTGWMLEGLDDEGRTRALDDLRTTMAAHETAAGVVFDSSMWLVTARRR